MFKMPKKININWQNLRETISQPVEKKPEHKEAVERITEIALKRLEQREAMKSRFAEKMAEWTSLSDSESSDSAVTSVNIDWSKLRPSIAQKIERKDEHTVVVERLTQIAENQLRFRQAMRESFAADMAELTSSSDSDTEE